MKFDLSFLNRAFKTKQSMPPLLYNRFVLYFISFLAILDILYFANIGDIQSFFTFLIIGFLTSFFSKNMIVILVISMAFTHILRFGIQASVSHEGMANKEDANTEENKLSKSDTEETNADESDKNDKAKKLKELRSAYKNYAGVKQDIISNIQELTPLLEKAETFIEKYRNYAA